MAAIWTIGHSTREWPEFVAALDAHEIKVLVDIRSIPMSRRYPHFNRGAMEKALPASGVDYLWEPGLGGRRRKMRNDSPNTALRNASFRNYADYMLTDDFRAGVDRLLEIASVRRVAILCAERVYFRCHRMLVSDWLVLHGHAVFHIDSAGPAARAHMPMAEARLNGEELIYDSGGLF